MGFLQFLMLDGYLSDLTVYQKNLPREAKYTIFNDGPY